MKKERKQQQKEIEKLETKLEAYKNI